ncbi:MAG TPA: hypothetical protein VEV13_04535 [Candidatus Limnocylindria bacterium]|nr:hypothetical protein [Candidatus Limnocylindria bacterium]
MDADAYGRGHEMTDDVLSRRALRRLLRVVVPTVAVVTLLLVGGVWAFAVLLIGAVVVSAAVWDYLPKNRRSRGGWIAPPMGSMSGDAVFTASSQGNNAIDPTGRVWTTKGSEPTPEQAAVGLAGGGGPTLASILLECVAYVVVVILAALLVVQLSGR